MRVTNPASGRVLLVEEVGLGGITDYTNELAQALTRAGWEVHLATGRDHDARAITNVSVHRVFPYLRRQRRLGRLAHRLGLARPINGAMHLAAYFLVARLARRCQVAHIQGEEWPPLAATLLLLLRATGRAVIYTPHNTFDRGGRSYPRAHWLIRRCATRIIVHSEYDRRALSAAQAQKAVVIAHGEYGGLALQGAPEKDSESLRAELGLSAEEPVALLFGQLRRDKGVRDLLAAAAEVEGMSVVLAGEDNGALNEVADLLEDPRLRGRVLVLEGFVPIERVGNLFGAVDVVALPYPRASASGVLLLAYGYGRPVLCYPVGGLPEYVLDGQTGWLCERADTAALAQGLRAIRAAGRTECRARGEAAKRFSQEHFGWDVIARQTIALYEEARTKTATKGERGA
jgi:glycosyltransferase involved in cell wall biosynthesis